VLGKLCAVYGLTPSRLMHLVEDDFPALVPHNTQPVWTDPETGFRRRTVSPPARALAGAAEPLYASLGYATAGVIPGYCCDPAAPDRLDATTIMYKAL
jgi:hypothetical protein